MMRRVGKSLKPQTTYGLVFWTGSQHPFHTRSVLSHTAGAKERKTTILHLSAVGVLLVPVRSTWKVNPRLESSALPLLANSAWTHQGSHRWAVASWSLGHSYSNVSLNSTVRWSTLTPHISDDCRGSSCPVDLTSCLVLGIIPRGPAKWPSL